MRSHSRQTLILCILTVLITLSASQNPPIAKPSCRDRCGGISIPFPFGTTEACSYSSAFSVTCVNNSLLFWRNTTGIEIQNISLVGNMTIMQDVSYECQNDNGSISSHNSTLSLPSTFFKVGRANKFIVVGCKAYGSLNGSINGSGFHTDCTTSCSPETNPDTVSCRGTGCCQKSIPRNLSDVSIKVTGYHNYSTAGRVSSCLFGFLSATPKYPSDITQLSGVKKLPMVLDWGFGNMTCEEAKKNPSEYACRSKYSVCKEPKSFFGYQCVCKAGFNGNPYLTDGCQDIDECGAGGLSKECRYDCVNTLGSFYCTCPKGYEGDGRNNGKGCTRARKRLTPQVATGISIGSAIGGLLLAYGALGGAQATKAIRRYNMFQRNGGSLLNQHLVSTAGGGDATSTMTLFTSDELDQATASCNESRILGQGGGGRGTTYKGMLRNGRIVAVKKLQKLQKGHVRAFIDEVVTLLGIEHNNIVALIGCCRETQEPLLTYEYVTNGSLFDLIRDSSEEIALTWEMRVRIATQVAGAISYLHCGSSKPMFHRDIKSGNVLLDEKFRAKVSYSGTLRSVSGTPGYVDPEYLRSNKFTDKSDVYSFGVVMVELLTGETAISPVREESGKSLGTDFLQAMKDDKLLEILDARVLNEGKVEHIVAFAELARRCLNLNGAKRPTMREVEAELERLRTKLNKGSAAQQENDPGDNNYLSSNISTVYTDMAKDNSGEDEIQSPDEP